MGNGEGDGRGAGSGDGTGLGLGDGAGLGKGNGTKFDVHCQYHAAPTSGPRLHVPLGNGSIWMRNGFAHISAPQVG